MNTVRNTTIHSCNVFDTADCLRAVFHCVLFPKDILFSLLTALFNKNPSLTTRSVTEQLTLAQPEKKFPALVGPEGS
jgi:hypothetical protein